MMRSVLLLAVVGVLFCVCVSAAPGEYARIRSIDRFFKAVLDKNNDGGMSQREVSEGMRGRTSWYA
jgi:hypothetical protein